MNRGQLHANLYADYLAELEARQRDLRERERAEQDDLDAMNAEIMWEPDCDDWFDEYEDDADSRAREYDEEVRFQEWLDDEYGWEDAAPETTAERYDRLWQEAGY